MSFEVFCFTENLYRKREHFTPWIVVLVLQQASYIPLSFLFHFRYAFFKYRNHHHHHHHLHHHHHHYLKPPATLTWHCFGSAFNTALLNSHLSYSSRNLLCWDLIQWCDTIQSFGGLCQFHLQSKAETSSLTSLLLELHLVVCLETSWIHSVYFITILLMITPGTKCVANERYKFKVCIVYSKNIHYLHVLLSPSVSYFKCVKSDSFHHQFCFFLLAC